MKRRWIIKNIYVDLDGPILDVSERYFFVHTSICRELGMSSTFGKKEYWEKKRAKEPVHKILDCRENQLVVSQYKKKWLQEIEKKDVLELDKIFPYVTTTLESLQKKYYMVLVTLRRESEIVVDEITKLNLSKYFKKILVVDSTEKPPHVSKYEAVSLSFDFDRNAIFVGDTEVDILAAKMLGIKSAMVLSGIRNESIARALNPDFIINDIRELSTIVKL